MTRISRSSYLGRNPFGNNKDGGLEQDERATNLNCMKMNLYLFCQMVELIEGDQANSIDTVTGAKRKGNKKSKDDDSIFMTHFKRTTKGFAKPYPQDVFKRPVLTSHQYGWNPNTLEIFGRLNMNMR